MQSNAYTTDSSLCWPSVLYAWDPCFGGADHMVGPPGWAM